MHIKDNLYINITGFIDITYPTVKPDTYEINNNGVIRNKKTKKIKKLENVKGYKRVTLINNKGKNIHIFIHRLVAWEFVYKPSNYFELSVNHADLDKENNYYKNLEWVTTYENVLHRDIMRGKKIGKLHPNAKYDEDVVIKICELINKGDDAPMIATKIQMLYPKFQGNKKSYDSIRGLVSKIKRGYSWKHIYNK